MSSSEYYRLRDKGKEHLTADNSSKAVDYYTRAINEGLKLTKDAYYLPGLIPSEVRAQCMESNEQHDSRSCSSCSKYLEIPICYANRSLAYFNLKKYEPALADAEKVIAQAPSWSKGYFRKAEALLGQEKYDEARLFYLQVIDYEPPNSPSVDLLQLRILNAELHAEARNEKLYFRPLIPGVHICNSTWNPISKIVFEFAKKMKNVVYAIGDSETRECVIVDPCWDVDGIIREVVQVDGMKIIGILATHNHFDHVGGRPPAPFDSYGVNVGGVARMIEKFPSLRVYIHKNDADVLQTEAFVAQDRIVATENGHDLLVGRHRIEFIHTPGHTPGSQCIRFGPGMRRVLTGDTLFCGSCGRVDFPGGNVNELYESLFSLISAWPDNMAIFPAHSYGGKLMTTLWYEKKHGVLRFNSRTEFAARLGVRPS